VTPKATPESAGVARAAGVGLGLWLHGLYLLVAVQTWAAPVLVVRGPRSDPYRDALAGFRQAYSSATEIDQGSTKEFDKRLRMDPPRMIVAIGRSAAEMVHQRAGSIPLFFLMVPDPAGLGLTGTNIAGVSMDVPAQVQLSRFKELLPDTKKPMAVIYNPATSAAVITQAQAAAPGLGIQLELVPVESSEQVRLRIGFVKPIIGSIWVVPDESFVTGERENKWFTYLLDEAKSMRMPFFISMNAASGFVREGALAAVVSDFSGIGRQAGELVNEIQSGKLKFESVGVRPPLALTWQIHRGTAQKIGLTIPPSVLQSATVFR